MTDTSSELPVCIHCGTSRPADETLCPNCQKPWIDVTIGTAPAVGASAQVSEVVPPPAPMPPPPGALSADDTGEFGFDDWTLPPEPTQNKSKWLIPIALLVAATALWGVVFLRSDSTPSTTVAALDTTTPTVLTTTTISDVVVTTAPSTTTTPTTLPLPAFPKASDWDAAGDPVATADLTLTSSGIGPISLGSSLAQSAGSLAASLGPAQEAGLESSTCAGTERYWLGWGSLTVYFDGFADDATFVAYRVEDVGRDGSGPEFETLSGLKVGDSVETLQATYTFYTVTFELLSGEDIFRLLENSEVLLWGPVTSTESSGTVQGIYSPDSCPSST